MKKPDYRFQHQLVDQAFKHVVDSGGCVLAAGCGAGKTNMAIEFIQRYLIGGQKRKIRILVLTHGQSHLRQQFTDRINDIDKRGNLWHPFSYVQATGTVRSFGKQEVVIALPQNFIRHKPEGEIDLLVVDEAHHFYFSNMIQSIIQVYKPKHQLLLTGTPSPFVRSKKFPIVSIASLQLLEHGVISSPLVELVQTTYDFKYTDLNTDGEVPTRIKFKNKDTAITLENLLKKINYKLRGQRVNKIAKEKLGWKVTSEQMGKTLIACRFQNQAKYIYKFFQKAGIDCALSVSDVDKGSSEINRFVGDPKCRILIVVSRGVLGFNLEELATVLDLTGSHNPDRLFQLLNRVARKSKKQAQKLFFKVTPNTMVNMTYGVMNYTMSLATPEEYQRYDGNFQRVKFLVHKKFKKQLEIASKFSKSRAWNIDLKACKKKIPAILKELKGVNATVTESGGIIKVKSNMPNIESVLQKMLKANGVPKSKIQERVQYKGNSSNKNTVLPRIITFNDLQKDNESLFNEFAYTDFEEIKNKLGIKVGWDWDSAKKAMEPYIKSKSPRARADFIRFVHGAADWINRHPEHQEEFNRLLPPTRLPTTAEKVDEAAAKCKNYSEFRNNHPSYMVWCRKNSYLDIVKEKFGHTTFRHSVKRCLSIASKCESRKEFQKNHGSEYGFLCNEKKLGLLDKIHPPSKPCRSPEEQKETYLKLKAFLGKQPSRISNRYKKLKPGLKIQELCKKFGVSYDTYNSWKKKFD